MPFKDEGQNIDTDHIIKFISKHNVKLAVVNDSSTDNLSLQKLEILERSNFVTLLNNKINLGKGPSLKIGIDHLSNLATPPSHIAIFDADFSSTLEEIYRLYKIALDSDIDIVCGSRIANWENGNQNYIKTNPMRKYLGSIFSTLVKLRFNLDIKDTQCGYKVFKSSSIIPIVDEIKNPSKWLLDLQILVRARETLKIIEIPLKTWIHKKSHLKVHQMLKTTIELIKLEK